MIRFVMSYSRVCVLLASTVAVACSGAPLDVAPTGGAQSTPANNATPAPATAAPVTPAGSGPTVTLVTPDDGVLPRQLSYGIPVWTLNDAVITNQDPKQYVAGEEGRPVKDLSAILDFT